MNGLHKVAMIDDKNAAYFFVAPALVGLILFIAVPFVLAVLLSVTNLHLGSPLPLEFVGLDQYRAAFADPEFQHALSNNFLFVVFVVPVQTALALFLALLVNSKIRGSVLYRIIFFMPVVFPMSLLAVVWILIYAPGPQGIMNSFLQFVSLGLWQPRDFLHDPQFALPAIMLMSIWQGTGFQMVIILAGLQSIPGQLYEAAALDRAGNWSQFWHVTLPQLRATLIFVVLLTTILAFRLFDQVQIMTHGGPNNATTTVMFEAVRTVFERQQVARGAAITVIFFVIVLVITLLQRRTMRNSGGAMR